LNYEQAFQALLVTLIIGNYLYTYYSLRSVWRWLNNHLKDRIKEAVKEELGK